MDAKTHLALHQTQIWWNYEIKNQTHTYRSSKTATEWRKSEKFKLNFGVTKQEDWKEEDLNPQVEQEPDRSPCLFKTKKKGIKLKSSKEIYKIICLAHGNLYFVPCSTEAWLLLDDCIAEAAKAGMKRFCRRTEAGDDGRSRGKDVREEKDLQQNE